MDSFSHHYQLSTSLPAHSHPLCWLLPSVYERLPNQSPGHGEEELLVMSGINQPEGEDCLLSGHQKVWLATPLALKSGWELMSPGSEEVNCVAGHDVRPLHLKNGTDREVV